MSAAGSFQKKILIISPVPTHPDSAGNRKGVLNIVNFFKCRGDDVSFLFLEMESFSFDEMNQYFHNKLFVIDRNDIFNPEKGMISFFKKLKHKIKSFLRYIIGNISLNDLKFNSHVDYLIGKKIINQVTKICNQNWDIVVCEYVWLSKLLDYFPKNVLKIIDTHDCFSNRYKKYLEMKIVPQWVSLFNDEEIIGLKRADIVIALNKKDEAYFKSKLNKEVIRFQYLPEINTISNKEFDFTLLYFASSNVNNINSINWFLNDIFPELQKKIKTLKLYIGGTISNEIISSTPGVFIKGEFEDPIDFYKLGDIVINPEISGSGFKIKSAEALAYGFPLISSNAGALGLSDLKIDIECPILIAETQEDYLKHILYLSAPDNFEKISTKGISFIDMARKQSSNCFSNSISKFLSGD